MYMMPVRVTGCKRNNAELRSGQAFQATDDDPAWRISPENIFFAKAFFNNLRLGRNGNWFVVPVVVPDLIRHSLFFPATPKPNSHGKSLWRTLNADGSEPSIDLGENLRRAITESGLEPRILLELIEAAASARISNGETALVERLLRAFKGEFDDFADSMKAGQMEIVARLSERSLRRAEEYKPQIIARIGSALFSELHEMTQQLLKQAEFQYHINDKEPNYFHGATLTMALAYETELNMRVVWPILKQLFAAGV